MPNERLAQTYAQAIFDQAMADWLTSLKTIAASLTRAGVTEQLDNARNLASLLASKNHVHLLPQVIAEFDQYAQRVQTRQRATITSAVPLTAAEQSALETKLRAQFGAELTFEYTLDAQILGGVIARIGDKVIDGSVAGKLAELKEILK